ncbi:MAG: hypothetical protein WD066_09125 [Planctomycetaceae bacterium]
MAESLCMPVLYRYMKSRLPKLDRWHTSCSKADKEPSLCPVGVLDLTVGPDEISILIAVPSNEQGDVDLDTQGAYEDIANAEFQKLRPHAVLA